MRIKLCLMAIICLSFVLFHGCFTVHSTSISFNVSGIVTEALDGAPMVNADVAIDFEGLRYCPQVTRPNGSYTISACRAPGSQGHTKLYAAKSGYKTQYIDLEITESLQVVNIALEREAP